MGLFVWQDRPQLFLGESHQYWNQGVTRDCMEMAAFDCLNHLAGPSEMVFSVIRTSFL